MAAKFFKYHRRESVCCRYSQFYRANLASCHQTEAIQFHLALKFHAIKGHQKDLFLFLNKTIFHDFRTES